MGLFNRKKKSCIVTGCRNKKLKGQEFCEEHVDADLQELGQEKASKDAEVLDEKQDDRIFDPVEEVYKLTVAEADKWGRLDAEIRNALQGQRILALESKVEENAERERRLAYQQKQLTRQQEAKALDNQIAVLKLEYQGLTNELANKYEVELSKLVIDPGTRVIRELT